MKLENMDLMRLLPHFMQDDKNAKAFARAVEKQFNFLTSQIKQVMIYSRIDELNDEMLDELAWQFNVIEYNPTYNITTKRELVKKCMINHRRRGTVNSVSETLREIFGSADIKEWFEYNGKPYHFKVYTSNPSASDEMLRELNQIIQYTQNIRSHLEEVIVELLNEMKLYFGAISIIIDIENFTIKKD